jgi:hypothetical protein
MAGKYSVKNTLEVVDLGIAVGVGLKNAKADGKLDLSDIQHVFPVVFSLQPAIDELGVVPKELGELDQEELALIVAHVASKLPQVTDNARVLKLAGAYLEAGLAVAKAVVLTLESDAPKVVQPVGA